VKISNYERGQSMFELVVAIAISALVIVTIVSLTTISIRNSNFSKNKSLASTYAQQATEWLRGQRDIKTEAFIDNVRLAPVLTKRCLNNLSWTQFPCASGTTIPGTLFQRDVVFDFGGDTETVIYADVTVSWTDSQGVHQVTSATSFSDWRER
jgi:type II secretory pathway pseudopilin PulG